MIKSIIFLGFIFYLSLVSPLLAANETSCLVITQKDIIRLKVLTVQEVLNQVPGVKATSSSVSLWGSTKVKVLLDGRPINDPTSSHGGVKWDLVPVKNIEKIEICKGSGSVEFGDDSSGGVILITTKKVSSLHGYIQSYIGNLNTKSIESSCKKNIEKLGLSLSGAFYSTDGYRLNGDKEKWRLGFKGEVITSSKKKSGLSIDYYAESGGSPGLLQFPTPHARKKYQMLNTSLLISSNGLASNTYFYLVKKEHKDPDCDLYTNIQVETYGQEFKKKLSLKYLDKLNTGAGGEFSLAKGSYFSSVSEEKVWLFASKGFSVVRKFFLFLGVRGNYYSAFGLAFNPELLVKFEKKTYEVRISLNQTNNIPTLLQRYNKTSTTMPNPDLEMERAFNRSFNFLWNGRKAIQFSISLFYNTIYHRITYVRGEEGIGKYENLGEVLYQGIEASLNWKPEEVILCDFSYTYLHARDEETKNWLPGKPWHRLKATVYYHPRPFFSLVVYATYVSKQFSRADNKESVPPYFLLDFTAEYYWNKVHIFLKINNLFDKEYFYGDGYPAPPRTWLVGLNYQF